MPEKNPNSNPSPNNNRMAIMFLVSMAILFVFIFFMMNPGQGTETISYSQFLIRVNDGSIEKISILDNSEIRGKFKDVGDRGKARNFKTAIPYFDDSLLPLLKEKGIEVTGGSKAFSLWSILLQILPLIVIFILLWWIFRSVQGGGNKAFSFGKSKAKRYDLTKDKVTFTDVAGQKESKYELMEVVEFLKDPEKFTRIGARIPKGVLLVGNPGTGKTLLAKAVAGEAGVPFFHMSGSDFVEMFVGVGASRVRDMFEQGRKSAPCILFIDEIDAVGRTRGAGYGGGHDEREQTLNQLLVEMDGFDTKTGVIMLAATNRPDVLDPALLRPGRFDRQVVVGMPDVKEREEILKIHSRKVKVDVAVNLETIAKATPGSSGADLANVVNEAALFAARDNRETVEMRDFEEARDKILMGVARKSMVLTEKEKLMTAYHEAGHTLLHYHLENSDPIHKVTIIPRGRALGVTFSLPEDEKHSYDYNWLIDRIVITYGGYVAEELIYRQTTSGAKQDIEMVTNLARRMVCEWGMSPLLGPVAFGSGDEPIFIGKEIAQHKDYSDKTADLIDQEIRRITGEGLNRARKILSENREQLELLTRTLVERETIEDREIRELLGFPPLEKKTGEV